MAGKCDAYIVEVEGKFMVRPSVVAFANGAGKKFSIRNMTDFPATVTLDDTLQPDPDLRSQTVDVRKVGKFTLSPGDGVYQYEVWLDLGGPNLVRVHGESDPVIIIDP